MFLLTNFLFFFLYVLHISLKISQHNTVKDGLTNIKCFVDLRKKDKIFIWTYNARLVFLTKSEDLLIKPIFMFFWKPHQDRLYTYDIAYVFRCHNFIFSTLHLLLIKIERENWRISFIVYWIKMLWIDDLTLLTNSFAYMLPVELVKLELRNQLYFDMHKRSLSLIFFRESLEPWLGPIGYNKSDWLP